MTHSGAGRARFTGGALELRVGALACTTFTRPSAVTNLLVAGETCAGVQRAVAGAARPVGLADTHPALAASMSLEHQERKAPLQISLSVNKLTTNRAVILTSTQFIS